ncbi:hypothetical protein [Marinoscillum furvescens]|uniref:Uncharacterized protein n=1 Tax=Marinoscillum furvescens DSM 4134 TaxID=1122208 RepID=A0A3D9L5L0_MARFU|nr:hypothetical protein [Marinoscillum furvescens]RED99575.1 hypothetical protein C7460_108197 [Marinoscillum furvescens DSM 4134]
MEINESYSAFLDVWHMAMWYLFIAAMAVGGIVLVAYWLRYATATNLKTKHDIAGESEIKTYLNVNYILAVGIFFLVNTTYAETIILSPIWLFVRIFIGMCIGTLHAYIAFLIFKYYYPGPLEKKLKKLRYTPRVNPNTGNQMKLLSEEEEDAYLDEGMQAEEDAFSVDYDVWIDEETGETHIEKYKGHLSAFECDRCGFQTLKINKETIIKQPTEFEDGQIEKEYKCSYCGRIKRKTQNLATKVDKDASDGKLISDPLGHDNRVDTVKIEIHSTKGENKIFEFQNVDQAKHFLEEFDLKKLGDQEM